MQIALAILLLYIVGLLIVWYFLRFTELYRNRHHDPAAVFLIIFWPVGLSVAGLVCAFRALERSRMIAGADSLVGRAFKRLIHSDEYGELYEMPSPRGNMRVVRVRDSTGTYWLAVPPEMWRARQAVAWTYSMTEEEFNPVRV
jgi:hypothetical protein